MQVIPEEVQKRTEELTNPIPGEATNATTGADGKPLQSTEKLVIATNSLNSTMQKLLDAIKTGDSSIKDLSKIEPSKPRGIFSGAISGMESAVKENQENQVNAVARQTYNWDTKQLMSSDEVREQNKKIADRSFEKNRLIKSKWNPLYHMENAFASFDNNVVNPVKNYAMNTGSNIKNVAVGGVSGAYQGLKNSLSSTDSANSANSANSDMARLDTEALYKISSGFIGALSPLLDNMTKIFSGVSDSLNQLAQSFGGFTMEHTVTVDGLISIGGLNIEAVKTELSSAIGEMVGQEVTKRLNEQNDKFKSA